ncbi:MAG: YrdB family protein [Acidimicrobiia bacterium]
MIENLRWLNVGLRGLMELGIVIAFAVWGFHTPDSTVMKVVLAIAAPVIVFGFWGLVDFRGAGRVGEPLRLIQELVVSGLAALAWYGSGQHLLGLALGAVSIVYHTLVYAIGDRLLEQPV